MITPQPPSQAPQQPPQQSAHQAPQQFTAVFEEKIIYNDKYVEYHFELQQPHRMEFAAGQYVSMKVSERGDRRSYSICSSPLVQHGFELLLDVSPHGIGTQYIENLNFGDQVEVLAPLGGFVIQQQLQEEEFVFVATGSGIAPFRSMLLDLLQGQHDTRPITLYWGLRHAQHLFWQNDFLDLAQAFPNFKFHPVISQAVDEWPLCRGRVTDCLSIHELPKQAGYYLCGNAAMITEVNTLLQQKGVLEQNIHYEKFY
jgi:NAD(P)H-flavin reductase